MPTIRPNPDDPTFERTRITERRQHCPDSTGRRNSVSVR
jgi:hypothetical protein